MGKARLSDRTLRLLNQYEESIVGNFDWSFYFSNKQCHEQLWNKIVEILPEYFGYYKQPFAYKNIALDLLGFYEKVTNHCYACHSAKSVSDYHINCDYCPIPIHCSVWGWKDFTDGLYKDNLELALKGAKSLTKAWREGE